MREGRSRHIAYKKTLRKNAKKCAICGKVLHDDDPRVVDHIIPLAPFKIFNPELLDILDDTWNYQVVCQDCNIHKATTIPTTFTDETVKNYISKFSGTLLQYNMLIDQVSRRQGYQCLACGHRLINPILRMKDTQAPRWDFNNYTTICAKCSRIPRSDWLNSSND